VESQLATKTDGSIISVRERGEELARTGKAVTVGGILAEVQIRTTKMGKQYARVVLEDLGASMEINFSANNFEKFSGFLTKDNIVLVKVRPGFDEELRFSAMDVELLSVERGNEELRLALRPEDLTRPPLAHFVRSSRDTPVVHRSSWRPVAPARPSNWAPSSTSTSRASWPICAPNSVETS